LKVQATQNRCDEAGFFTYLSKPLNIANFETTLKTVYQYRQVGVRDDKVDPTEGPNQAIGDIDEPSEVNNAKEIKARQN
jgi:hypothetical protein